MTEKKLLRNLDTEADRKFWEEVLRSAKWLEDKPIWYRAGIVLSNNYERYDE